MKTIAFHTLGCKLNFSETSTIARSLQKDGYEVVPFESGADVYVINTCSVTENADKKCRKVVKEAKRRAPDSFVAIIGCYAQLKPQEIVEIPGVDAVLGAAEKFRLAESLNGFLKTDRPVLLNSPVKEVKDYVAGYSIGSRTRTFLKVQDGCNYNCAFCTIPLARGKSRSDTIASVLTLAAEIAEQGVHEIVLTGVNIGDFGIQDGRRKETFFELVQELDAMSGIERFRISSIEPNLLTEGVIDFVAGSKHFVPHFHIPLQSGSDAILQAMHRRYRTDLYQTRVASIKSAMPHACIGVDVIVGFPGETDEEFLKTYEFLNQLDISYLHVFTYSERENTPAVSLKNPVPQHKRAERSRMLHILSDKKRRAFYQAQLGTNRQVLWEDDVENGLLFGFTENYVRVSTPYNPELVGELSQVKLLELQADLTVSTELLEQEVLTH